MLKISKGNLTDYQIKELIPILKGLDGKPLKDVILSFKESDYAHLVIPVLINSTNIIDEWDNPGISFNSQNTIFILYARSSDIDLLATALNQSRNGTIKEVALSSLEKIGSQTAADIIVKWAIEKKSASDFDVISILENLGHESCIKFLVEVIQKSDEYTLSSAYNCAFALGNIGSKDALTPLIRFFFDQLDDTNLWEIKFIKLAQSIVKLGGGKEIIDIFHQQLLPENVVINPRYHQGDAAKYYRLNDVIEIIVSVGHSESVVYFMELIDYIQKNSQGDGSVEYRILKPLILGLGELKDISAIGFLTELLEESIEIMNLPESNYRNFSLGQFAVLAIGRIKEDSHEYQGIPIEIIRDISKRSDDFLQGNVEDDIRRSYPVTPQPDSKEYQIWIPKPRYIRNTSLRINSIFALGMIGDIKAAQDLIELLLFKQDLQVRNSLSKVIDEQNWPRQYKEEEIRKEIVLIERRISNNLSIQYPNKKFEISDIEVGYLYEDILSHVILESITRIIHIHHFSEVIEEGLTKFTLPFRLNYMHQSDQPKIRYEDLLYVGNPTSRGGRSPFNKSKRKKYSLREKAKKILELMDKNKKKIEKTPRKPIPHRAHLLKKRRK